MKLKYLYITILVAIFLIGYKCFFILQEVELKNILIQ